MAEAGVLDEAAVLQGSAGGRVRPAGSHRQDSCGMPPPFPAWLGWVRAHFTNQRRGRRPLPDGIHIYVWSFSQEI